MKRTMQLLTLLCFLFMSIDTSWAQSGTKKSKHTIKQVSPRDQLSSFVKKAYKQIYESNMRLDFDFKTKVPGDTLIIGLDWDIYFQRAAELKASGLFSREFLNQYYNIAVTVDSSIKESPRDWRNLKEGTPIWESDNDLWCNCKDKSIEYWKGFTLERLIANKDSASFELNWTVTGITRPYIYRMKTVKEEGQWRISYMGGFENFGPLSYYRKMAKAK